MSVNDLDEFYLTKEEPLKSCLMALSSIILSQDKDVTPAWKYRLPFFCYKEKMFCYLWIDAKTKEPYIGFVEGGRLSHPLLEQGNRKRMKILRIDPTIDLPMKTLKIIIKEALDLYRKGIIKTKK